MLLSGILIVAVLVYTIAMSKKTNKEFDYYDHCRTVLKGMFPSFVIGIFLAVVLSAIMKIFFSEGNAQLSQMQIIGISEEAVKIFFCAMILKDIKINTKMEYVLSLGGMGLAFDFIENAVAISNGNQFYIKLGLLIPLHFIISLQVGAHLFEYRKAEEYGVVRTQRREFFLAIVLPVLIHIFVDYFMVEAVTRLTIRSDFATGCMMFVFMSAIIVLSGIHSVKAVNATVNK